MQLLLGWLRHNNAARRGLAKHNLVRGTKIANAVEMAEKIEHEGLLPNQGRNHTRPDRNCVSAAYGLLAFGFDQLHADGFDARPKVHRLYIQRKRRKVQLAHSSSSA